MYLKSNSGQQRQFSMAYKSKICKAFFVGLRPDCFAPNHPPNFPRPLLANPIQINGLPIAIFDLAEICPNSPLAWRQVVGCDGWLRKFFWRGPAGGQRWWQSVTHCTWQTFMETRRNWTAFSYARKKVE